jgi:protocatechuate 4,5-dioxygenase beta chain
MAKVVGAVATSHVPLIGKAIARGWQDQPYWKPFFDGYGPVRQWLAEVRPDLAVVVYNDHGLNFFLDKLPTFAIGAAPTYCNADEGWGLPVAPPFPGHPELSWHIIESVVADEFDVTTCQEMLVDHGLTVPMALLWPGERSVRIVPITVNHVQYPLPSPTRCFKFGRAIGRALATFDAEARILLVATGGLSHQLDGARAGFINRRFDLFCLDKIATDPEAMTRLSILDIVREAGAQGTELLTWLVVRGALPPDVVARHAHYHAPISNTGAAVLVLEPSPREVAAA